jgi:hypothetical protein
MSNINNFVPVTITRESANILQAGFGTVMIWGVGTTGDVIKKYADLTELVVDYATSTDIYKCAASLMSQEVTPTEFYVGLKLSAHADYAASLAAIRASNDEWYAACLVSRTEADLIACAAAIEATSKILFVTSADADIIAAPTTDVASLLKTAGYDRTAIIYSTDANTWANAAWLGGQLSKPVGSINWNFKELKGVAAEVLTSAQVGYLAGKNCNVQETVAGLKRVTYSGVVASGEYIDIIHGIDWLTARIGEGVFRLLATLPKIGFKTPDLMLIKSEIIFRLLVAANINNFILEDSIVVNVPKLADIDPLDKAARVLNNVTFSATLTGAINKISIAGKLVV